MEPHFTIVKVASVIITALGMMCFIWIGKYIIKAHKDDKNYKRRKTVIIFNWLFALLGISEIVTALDILFGVHGWIVSFFYLLKGILIVVTVINYYLSIDNFAQINIPKKDAENDIQKIKTTLKNEIINWKLPEKKREAICHRIDELPEL